MGIAALRDRGFRWFFLARTITLITGSMSSIALAFAVLGIDNDAAALSIVLTAFTVANIVFLLSEHTGIDLSDAIAAKMAKNERKYPAPQ